MVWPTTGSDASQAGASGRPSLTSAVAARPSSVALSAIASATATTGPSSTTVTSSVIRLAATVRRPPTARSSQRKAGQLVDTRIAAHTSEVRKGHSTSTQPAPSRARARMGRMRSELKFGMGGGGARVRRNVAGIMRVSLAGLEIGAGRRHWVPCYQRPQEVPVGRRLLMVRPQIESGAGDSGEAPLTTRHAWRFSHAARGRCLYSGP